MKINIIANSYTRHAELLKRHLGRRIPISSGEDMTISLSVDKALGVREGYKIEEKNGSWEITGSDSAGLYYGIGKLLHTAVWSEAGFLPKPPVGFISPACSFRAMYFAVHFYNWYQNAPLEELERYIEELLLWGLQQPCGDSPYN